MKKYSEFTEDEKIKLVELYPIATTEDLLNAVPGRTMEQVKRYISNRNKRIKFGQSTGNAVKRPTKLSDRGFVAKKQDDEEYVYVEPAIFREKIITDNIYAYRLGFELPHITYGRTTI